jgi:hypothetical protein
MGGGPRPARGSFGGGFGPRPGGAPGRDRSANFGPPAPPRRLRGTKKNHQHEYRPRGPIKERTGGRIYAVDDLDDDTSIDIDNFATRAPDNFDDVATRAEDDESDDR